MKKKITFQNMDHSENLEAHTNQKLQKVEELLKTEESFSPHFLEVWLKAHKQHPHHGVEIHLKTPHADLHAHEEGTDMYAILDMTIDKIVKLIKKHKDKLLEKRHKVSTPKQEFAKENGAQLAPFPETDLNED